MVKTAIVGIGRWGKKLLREMEKISDVSICCYRGNKENLQWIKKYYPNIKITTNGFDNFVAIVKNFNQIKSQLTVGTDNQEFRHAV